MLNLAITIPSKWDEFGGVSPLAEVRLQEVESLENALRPRAGYECRLSLVRRVHRVGMVEGGVSMEFQDKVLKCIDCGADFIFTAGEQLFFHDKQFKNEPKRCKACKTKRVSVLGATPRAPGQGFAKVETRTVCSQCGKETTVPFKPT